MLVWPCCPCTSFLCRMAVDCPAQFFSLCGLYINHKCLNYKVMMLDQKNSKFPSTGKILRFLFSSLLMENTVQQTARTCLNTITCLLSSLPSPRLDVSVSTFLSVFHIQYFSVCSDTFLAVLGREGGTGAVNHPSREPHNIHE